MTLTDLWKDFIVLFATKGRRKLRDLEKIQDKTFRVQKSLEDSRKNMDEALVTVKTELGTAKFELKELNQRLNTVEDNLIIAVDRNETLDQNILLQEIQTLTQEIAESETTVSYLSDLEQTTMDKRDMLLLDIAEADRIIRVSNARYRTAETLLRANAGNISADVFKEIEEIKKESVKLQERNVAVTAVADLDQKRSVKSVIARNQQYASLPAAEMAAQIKAKRLEQKEV